MNKQNIPYRPSNGEEGAMFEQLWCENCKHYDDCSILLMAMIYDKESLNYPKELIISSGQPICKSFENKNDTI